MRCSAPGGVLLTGSRQDEYTTLAIPETLGGQPVVELAEDAFIDKLFQKVTLPKTVEKLGDGLSVQPGSPAGGAVRRGGPRCDRTLLL